MAVSAPKDKRFRRARVSPVARRDRGRTLRVYVGVAVLTVAILGVAYLAVRSFLTVDALTITRITVSGNTRVSRGDALALLDGLRGRNMLLLNLETWRMRMLASPWVEDVAIRRVLPGTVDVAIEERQPVGLGRIGDAIYLLDQRGNVIDEFGPDHAEFDFPIIDGLAMAAPREAGAPVIDASRAALAMRLLAALHARPDLATRVSQIDVSDARDAVILLKGDTALVRVGDEQFIERLQSYLDLAPALRREVPQIDYVDLRFGERVYVRPQATAARVQRVQGGGE
ncbi:MAG: FtsQ-type POTRA domain-containing protein [Acidobacteria bacterium]|nr:FtsQ-type POTRA domain-containing protein [Acidobacteriota bacterium]